jgi:hypothetical protein
VKVFLADEASDPDPVPKVLRVASAAHSPTGSVVAGTVLTATYGAVTDQAGKPVADAVIGYEWVRKKNAFTETAGTARTYTTKAGDAGWELWVRVCASKSGYQPGCVDSPGSVKVTAPPVPQVPAFTPTVSGTVKVDATLTVAGVPSGYTAAYQWLRDGAVIGGATGSSYKVGSADVGKRLSVKVTLSKAGYTSRTATSGQVGPVPTPLAPPAARVAMFSLGQDMTGNGYGETLTVWTDGTVRRHGASKGTPVGAAQVLATGWQGSRVYGPGDLTGDKRGDLLRITPQGDLFLYPGDGKGGIGAAVKVGWGWQGYRLMPCGDLDRDGKPDLLGVDEATGKLWFYPGTGNGRFGAKRNVGWGWKGFDLYAAGDVTGDGKPDILSVKRTAKGELYVYPGTGKGQFAAKKQAGWGWSGFKLASGADLNGDGRADLLGVNNQTGQVWFYPGNGKAGFGKTSLNLRW